MQLSIRKYFWIFSMIILCYSCQRNSEPERDIIQFNVPINAVCDSMRVMNSLMDKLDFPKSEKRIKSWLILDNDTSKIDINGYVLEYKKLRREDFEVFLELEKSERFRFMNLLRYCIKNNLTSCRYDYFPHKNKHAYFYDYRNYAHQCEPAYTRDLVVNDSSYNIESKELGKDWKLLDKKNGLALFKIVYPRKGTDN